MNSKREGEAKRRHAELALENTALTMCSIESCRAPQRACICVRRPLAAHHRRPGMASRVLASMTRNGRRVRSLRTCVSRSRPRLARAFAVQGSFSSHLDYFSARASGARTSSRRWRAPRVLLRIGRMVPHACRALHRGACEDRSSARIHWRPRGDALARVTCSSRSRRSRTARSSQPGQRTGQLARHGRPRAGA